MCLWFVVTEKRLFISDAHKTVIEDVLDFFLWRWKNRDSAPLKRLFQRIVRIDGSDGAISRCIHPDCRYLAPCPRSPHTHFHQGPLSVSVWDSASPPPPYTAWTKSTHLVLLTTTPYSNLWKSFISFFMLYLLNYEYLGPESPEHISISEPLSLN